MKILRFHKGNHWLRLSLKSYFLALLLFVGVFGYRCAFSSIIHLDKYPLKAQPTLQPSVKPSPEIPLPCSGQEIHDLPWLEQKHQILSQRLCDQIEKLDLFFGNMQFEEELPRSFVRIRNAVSWSDSNSNVVKFDPHINARIRIPALETRLNLLISDDTEDRNSLSTSQDSLRFDPEETNRISTALSWIVQQSERMQLDLDAGIRSFDPFLRARYRNRWMLSDTQQVRFLQEIFWKQSEKFGERSEFNYDETLSAHLLLRINTATTFSEVSEGVDWTQRFSIIQKVDDLRALSYTTAFTGRTRPHFLTEDYGISVRYRKNVYHGWLFSELEVQVNWPAELWRDTTQTLILRLEMQFGRP